MGRKIVFINQATGYLTIDVINEFANDFDEVALITGSIRIQDTLLHPGIRVSKIVRYNRGNNFRKALSWIIGSIQIYFLLAFKYRGFEKFFYTIPPTAYLLALKFKNLYSIIVFDLYPDALKVFGINEKGIVYHWWAKRNKQLFSRAHLVITLSERMKSKILDYSSDAIVRNISNWSGFSGFIPIEKESNSIKKREGRENKFIVQYSGNIGYTHKVEILVELADLLKQYDDIEFLIIGRGDRSSNISEMIESKGLTNCSLLPYRKDEELYESLCVADVAVVTLDDKAPDISVPSKLYNIMAAGVPVMAIARQESSVASIVENHGVGMVFEKEDFNGMVDFVLRLKNNPKILKRISMDSLKASEDYTNTNALKYLQYYNN